MEIKKAVVQPGFEPGQTEPKPVVLPLHHWTIGIHRSVKSPLEDLAKLGNNLEMCK